MNFNGFSRFCTDFEIFPDILSKPKIMRFFKTLSGFFETTAKQSQAGGNGGGPDSRIPSALGDNTKPGGGEGAAQRRDVVDEHLFVEALALTAFEIVYQDPQPSDAEKIILLMERLNHSTGPQKVQQAVGKTRFPGQSGEIQETCFTISGKANHNSLRLASALVPYCDLFSQHLAGLQTKEWTK